MGEPELPTDDLNQNELRHALLRRSESQDHPRSQGSTEGTAGSPGAGTSGQQHACEPAEQSGFVLHMEQLQLDAPSHISSSASAVPPPRHDSTLKETSSTAAPQRLCPYTAEELLSGQEVFHITDFLPLWPKQRLSEGVEAMDFFGEHVALKRMDAMYSQVEEDEMLQEVRVLNSSSLQIDHL